MKFLLKLFGQQAVVIDILVHCLNLVGDFLQSIMQLISNSFSNPSIASFDMVGDGVVDGTVEDDALRDSN